MYYCFGYFLCRKFFVVNIELVFQLFCTVFWNYFSLSPLKVNHVYFRHQGYLIERSTWWIKSNCVTKDKEWVWVVLAWLSFYLAEN